MGLPVEERIIDRTELYVADEMFYLGTGWEIKPVSSVDRIPFGKGGIGPVTQQIMTAYRAIASGNDKRFPEWHTPVW